MIVLTIAPVTGLLRFAAQNNSTVYDHYLYLAMTGPAIALAWLLGHRPWPRLAFVLIAVGLLAPTAKWPNIF